MRIVIAILITASAMRLVAQSGPAVAPKEVTMRVGDAATLTGYQHPGGLSVGFPYRYDFSSDAPAVAAVRGFASGQSIISPDPLPGNGVVYVIAMAPGIAHVRTSGYPLDLATITVLPPILPVEIRANSTHAMNGQQVLLTAVIPGYEQTATFSWYFGRIGDFAHPIHASFDPHLTFTVTGVGTVRVWVQALAGSVASSDEISIEIVQPRRRAAR